MYTNTAADILSGEIQGGPVAKCHVFDEDMIAVRHESVRGVAELQGRIVETDEAIGQGPES